MQKSGFFRALQASLLMLSLVAMNLAPITSALAQTTDGGETSSEVKGSDDSAPSGETKGGSEGSEGGESPDSGTGGPSTGDDSLDTDTDTDTGEDTDTGGDALTKDISKLYEETVSALTVGPEFVTVTIYKYIDGEEGEELASSGTPAFNMNSTWTADNGSGSGSYPLAGPTYVGQTNQMTSGASYATNEVTDGNPALPIGAECAADKYRLVGYRVGDSREEAEEEDLITTSPNLTNIISDKVIIVVNEDCDHLPPAPVIPTTIVVKQSDLHAWSSNNSAAATTGFLADAGAPLGDGALELKTTSDENDTARFSHVFDILLADLSEISFDTKQVSAADGVNGNASLRINIDTSGDGIADDQLMYEPYYNGFSGPSAAWKTWTIDSDTGKFWSNFEHSYNGHFPTPAGGYDTNITLDDVLHDYPGAKIVGLVISMGSYNFSQDVLVDELHVVSTDSDTTYDFEPEPYQACMLVSDGEDTYVGFNPATLTFEHDAWSDELDSDGAKWIWNAAEVTDPTTPETVTFTRSFNVTGSPSSATLRIAADNSYSVKLNNIAVPGCDGSGDSNFASVESCSLAIGSGANTLTFTVTNSATPGDSNAHNNPAGLYYEIGVEDASCTPLEPVPTATVTMCKKSDAEGNPGLSGWELYLKGGEFEHDISVPTNTSAGINSTNPLALGLNYLVTAVGTWANQGGANLVDAEYSTTDAWATHMDGYDGYQTDILELQINNQFDPGSNWGPYNGSHSYSRIYSPEGAGPANFRIFDGSGTTQNEGWFGDNSGNLAVDIDNVYAGTTEDGGCVTVTDVPYGTYTAGEIAQEGWTLTDIIDNGEEPMVDGMLVAIDEPTENFTFMNHEEVESTLSCVIGSDTTTIEGGDSSFIATFIHGSWTALIDGVSWIWGDAAIVDPAGSETQVFTKTFDLYSVPVTGGVLEIAADNSYEVRINDVLIDSDTNEDNYTSAGQDEITIPAANLVPGTNTLEITVTNFAMEGGTQETNPAGLKYKLTIEGSACTEIAPLLKVHILKYLSADETETQVADESGLPSFPMRSSWDAENIGAGSGSYELGTNYGGASDKYGADTSAMSGPADYTTYEVTTADDEGSIVLPANAACIVDKYRLVGYRMGATQDGAEAATISTTAPAFTDIMSDRYIIVVNEDCDDVLEGGSGDGMGTLTVIKNTVGGDGTFPFLVDSQDLDPEDAQGFSLTTTVENGHTDSETVPLEEGSYEVTEFRPNGWTLEMACVNGEGTTGTTPTPQSKLVTVEEGETITCTFTNTKDAIPPTPTSETIVVRDADLADDFGAVFSDPTKWFFYNDGNDTIDSSLGSFVDGPDTAPLGDGSVQMSVTGTERRNIATYQFKDVKLADIDALSFSAYSQSVGDGSPGTGRAPYLQFNIDFNNSDTWQKRIAFVPSINGVVAADTWQNWDAIGGGGALWVYSGANWPAGVTSVGDIPGTTARTWSAILADYPNAQTRSTDSWFGFRVGEPYNDGFTGNVDNFVIDINDGLTDHTKTFDFEPEAANNGGGGNGGGGGGGNNNSNNNNDGEVLGATTDGQVLGNECSLLTAFMREGLANDSAQVLMLQNFLNGEMGSGLPTSGFFGPMTTSAVNSFQLKYWEEVLKPWADIGMGGEKTPTGYVFKTTLWKINDIQCPDLDAPFPTLP